MPDRRYFPLDRWAFVVIGGALALLAVIGVADYFVTRTIQVVYLIPIAAAAWLVRGWWWLLVGLAAGATWGIAAQLADAQMRLSSTPQKAYFDSFFALAWEAGIRTLIFLFVGWLIARLQVYTRHPSVLTPTYDNTGLLSANGLTEAASRPETVDRFAHGPAAVLIIDLERKLTAYHGRGTEHTALVAAMMSRILATRTRANDVSGRPGGTQFVVMMPNVTEADAAAVAENILADIPAMRKALDDSFTATSLIVWAPAPPPPLRELRRFAETRLVAHKAIRPGTHRSERFELFVGPHPAAAAR